MCAYKGSTLSHRDSNKQSTNLDVTHVDPVNVRTLLSIHLQAMGSAS